MPRLGVQKRPLPDQATSPPNAKRSRPLALDLAATRLEAPSPHEEDYHDQAQDGGSSSPEDNSRQGTPQSVASTGSQHSAHSNDVRRSRNAALRRKQPQTPPTVHRTHLDPGAAQQGSAPNDTPAWRAAPAKQPVGQGDTNEGEGAVPAVARYGTGSGGIAEGVSAGSSVCLCSSLSSLCRTIAVGGDREHGEAPGAGAAQQGSAPNDTSAWRAPQAKQPMGGDDTNEGEGAVVLVEEVLRRVCQHVLCDSRCVGGCVSRWCGWCADQYICF
jgi:hypothetical protein